MIFLSFEVEQFQRSKISQNVNFAISLNISNPLARSFSETFIQDVCSDSEEDCESRFEISQEINILRYFQFFIILLLDGLITNEKKITTNNYKRL